MLHLFNVFRDNDGKENCAQVLEEEIYKMFGTKSLNVEHDCNVVSMNSLKTHDANDMQSHKLGDAMFDEYDIFSLPSFDEQIYYDDSMPPTCDDYCDDNYAIKSSEDYIYKTCHYYGYLFSEHYSFNVETIYNIQVFYDTPTIPRILLMWRVVNFLCL